MSADENWFGTRLSACRANARLTQEELSERMKVSLQTVRDWEKGRKLPHMRKVPLLAQVLDVEAGRFFPATPRPARQPDRVKERLPEDVCARLERIEARLDQVLTEVQGLRDRQD